MRFTILLLILFTSGQSLHSQQLCIVYEEYILSNIGESYRPGGANSNNHIIAMFTLRINNGVSWFTRDSIYLKFESPFNGFSPWATLSIYKNYNEDKWIHSSGTYMDGYALKKSLSDEQTFRKYYDWQITSEKKKILGVECIKAEAKNGDLAWFAPGIPYPDGPDHGVYNLPGLVLEYEMPTRKFTAKSLGIDKSEIIIPEFKFVKSSESIFIDEGLKSLPESKSIPLDKNTPLNQWLKFENDLQKNRE